MPQLPVQHAVAGMTDIDHTRTTIQHHTLRTLHLGVVQVVRVLGVVAQEAERLVGLGQVQTSFTHLLKFEL